MNNLKKIFILLVLFLLLVLVLDEIHYEDKQFIEFPSHFYFLLVAAVLTSIALPRLRWFSLVGLLSFWAVTFVVTAIAYFYINGFGKLQIILLEFILLEVSVFIAYQLNTQLTAAESLMSGLAANIYPNRTQNLNVSSERIDIELTRSRRHHRPLTVLVVEPEKASDEPNHAAYKALRQDLLQNFVDARVGQLISERARQTDMILRDRDGKFIILCVETDDDNAEILADRIKIAAHEELNASIRWGSAVFPKQALTFDELVQKAKESLGE